MDRFSTHISATLLHTASKLSSYTNLLSRALPPECLEHFHVAKISNHIITISVDSPVWATRIRQLGPMILDTIAHDTDLKIHHIKVITRRGPSIDKHTQPHIKRELSKRARNNLRSTADYIDDEKLKAALLRLSKRSV